MKSLRIVFVLCMMCCLFSCGDDDDNGKKNGNGNGNGTPGEFGETTSAVMVVNPVINEGSTTTIEPGTIRSGIVIQAGTLPSVTTNATGLAVLTDLPVDSMLSIIVDSGDTLFLNVVQEKDLYDIVVSFKDNSVQEIFPAVRYPVGVNIVEVDTTQNISDFIAEDNTIILLKKGIYTGDLTINAEGVLLFGAWSAEDGPLSVINGSVTVNGGLVRFRGVKIDSTITVRANDFAAAFCTFNNADISGNSILLLRNTFTGGQIIVPSSSAILVDNIGIP